MEANGYRTRYEELVLARLDSQQSQHEKIFNEIAQLKTAIAVVQIKSSLLGAAAGAFPSMLVALYLLMGGHQ